MEKEVKENKVNLSYLHLFNPFTTRLNLEVNDQDFMCHYSEKMT